jgi:hypothetical protein
MTGLKFRWRLEETSRWSTPTPTVPQPDNSPILQDEDRALQPTVLVARRIGIVSAALRSVSPISGSTDRSRSHAYRHPTAYGCTTVNATVIDASAMNAAVISASATPISESIS